MSALQSLQRLWRLCCALPEKLLFGPRADGVGAVARLLRAARYPYALWRDLQGGQLNLHAMGLVYASLLAIIPLLALSFGILKAFNAQGVLQPLVLEFFRPMGAAAMTLTREVMEFANSVRGGVVGLLGFGALIWTLIGTMRKVEDGFNFVWHVAEPRSFARRTSEYFALLVAGPLLVAAVVELSRLALDSTPVQLLSEVPWIDRLRALGLRLAPSLIASGLLTVLYVMIPNTTVRWRPALAGGVLAGVLWAAIGRIFTLFVVYSARLTVVYAGFAIIISALLWTYFGWVILLLGAQLSFYVQNPTALHQGLRPLPLSCVDTEQLALSIVYLIAAQRLQGRPPHSTSSLALQLGFSGIDVARLCRELRAGGFIAIAADDTLQLQRDSAQLRVLDILRLVRRQQRGLREQRRFTPPAVSALCARLEQCAEQCDGTLTLSALLEREGQEPGACL